MYDRSAKLVAKGVVIEYWLQRSRALFTAVQGVEASNVAGSSTGDERINLRMRNCSKRR